MTHAANSGQQHIELHSDEGCNLNICHIISNHFRLQVVDNVRPEQEICCSCWGALREFHQFYLQITEAHKLLSLKTTAVDAHLVDDDDVLPEQAELKSENTFNNGKLADELCLEDNFFDAEVKLEVQDLDLLPQIEVLEAFPVPNARAERAQRRRLQAQEITNKKDVKKTVVAIENFQSLTTTEQDAVQHLNTDVKPDDEVAVSIEVLSNVEPQRRRRGRPRKTKVEESISMNIINVKEEKIEHVIERKDSSVAGDTDNEDNVFPASIESCSGTDDSADSSSESSDEDHNRSDYETASKYAIIPKRVVVKPKKYRKRPKPEVPPKRMTREEIEKRNSQQAGYDEVIRKFFGHFSCPKCKVLVKNFGEIYAHFRVSHSKEIGYMTCCGRKFPQRKALAEHVYVHLNPEHFKCTQCGKVLQDSRNLEAHEEMHKSPSEQKPRKMFPCNLCDKSYTTKAAYEDHRYAKHMPRSEFKIPCPHCDRMLPTKRRLSGHIKYMHDPESAAVCDKCGKKLRNQSALRKHHQQLHSEVPQPAPVPVQCEICGTWYRHKKGLRQHMRSIHEDTGLEHRCHICNKVSVTANALKHHIYLNHRCERKFQCTMCEKAFKRLQDLREHTSTHTGKVLYTCPNCPMTFFSNANMYKHRQRLHRAQWEADRKKPIPPNIMQKAVGVAAKMAVPQVNTTLDLLTHKLNTNLFNVEQSDGQTN